MRCDPAGAFGRAESAVPRRTVFADLDRHDVELLEQRGLLVVLVLAVHGHLDLPLHGERAHRCNDHLARAAHDARSGEEEPEPWSSTHSGFEPMLSMRIPRPTCAWSLR